MSVLVQQNSLETFIFLSSQILNHFWHLLYLKRGMDGLEGHIKEETWRGLIVLFNNLDSSVPVKVLKINGKKLQSTVFFSHCRVCAVALYEFSLKETWIHLISKSTDSTSLKRWEFSHNQTSTVFYLTKSAGSFKEWEGSLQETFNDKMKTVFQNAVPDCFLMGIHAEVIWRKSIGQWPPPYNHLAYPILAV